MSLSVFDMFSIGIGPSSSHTVGPMRAAGMFAQRLESEGLIDRVGRVRAELFGSLGATGHGHGSEPAVVMGLEGHDPQTVDTDAVAGRMARLRADRVLTLLRRRELGFDPDADLVLHRRKSLPYHPNGMTFSSWDAAGEPLLDSTYYSVGGGFVVNEQAAAGDDPVVADRTVVPHPFLTALDLLDRCRQTGLPISGVMMENEAVRRSPDAASRCSCHCSR